MRSGWGVGIESGDAGCEQSWGVTCVCGSCKCPGEGVWTIGTFLIILGLSGGGGARYEKLGGAHSGESTHFVTR